MSGQDKSKKSVLFVCLGNICRSPLAEGLFRQMVKGRADSDEWTIDSCATGQFHTGEQPDSRCIKILRQHGINNYQHIVRQVTKADFEKFHYIFGMDEDNMKALRSITPEDFKGKLSLLGVYDPGNTTGKIRDPYYDNDDKGFKVVYDLAKKACERFLEAEGFTS